MLDDIIELFFELFLEGTIEVISSKSVPKFVRILLAVVIIAVLLALCGFLVGAGINEGEMVLIILGVGLFVVFAALAIYKVIQHRK